jgi:hypothetical protein
LPFLGIYPGKWQVRSVQKCVHEESLKYG